MVTDCLTDGDNDDNDDATIHHAYERLNGNHIQEWKTSGRVGRNKADHELYLFIVPMWMCVNLSEIGIVGAAPHSLPRIHSPRMPSSRHQSSASTCVHLRLSVDFLFTVFTHMSP